MVLWGSMDEDVFGQCLEEARSHPRAPEFKQYMLQQPDGPPQEWAEQEFCDPEGAPDEDLAEFCAWLAHEADEQDRLLLRVLFGIS